MKIHLQSESATVYLHVDSIDFSSKCYPRPSTSNTSTSRLSEFLRHLWHPGKMYGMSYQPAKTKTRAQPGIEPGTSRNLGKPEARIIRLDHWAVKAWFLSSFPASRDAPPRISEGPTRRGLRMSDAQQAGERAKDTAYRYSTSSRTVHLFNTHALKIGRAHV